jgi:hypothetical protein
VALRISNNDYATGGVIMDTKLIPTAPLGRLPTCPEEPVSRRRLLKTALALGAVSLAAPIGSAIA